uniref:DNA binding protein n=1 Tax=Oryza sativa subsp. japonica TaxID=39947 RepID=Q8S634_ORYSJ|nr:putative DNA binding protein [Oryza sativa Japonica Group]
MFRNKVLVRARAVPSAPPPPFILRQLSFPAAVPALDLDILCCRLSRRHRLACLPQPPSDVLVVYQRCQSCAAAEAVSGIAEAFEGAAVGEEEEVVCSGSLVAKAVECDLRSLMLEHGWRCLGESVYVLSTFADTKERTDQCTVNVEVKLGRNDDIEFAVSPDALRFTTPKFSDFVSSDEMETFENGKEVILDYCNFRTACTTLPTLQEGHVIEEVVDRNSPTFSCVLLAVFLRRSAPPDSGASVEDFYFPLITGFSKTLPTGQCLDKFMQLCSLKHDLEADYSHYAAVRFGYESSHEIWLPCSFVLQGSGLQPAPKSSRASRAMCALQSFMGLLNAWNFFGQNQLVIKEQLLLNSTATLPTWDKAMSSARTNNSEDLRLVHTNILTNDQSLALAQVALLKPSFSRGKSEQGHKRKHSSEHSDADNSDKLRHTSLTNSTLVTFPKASYLNPVSLSNASLSKRAETLSDPCRFLEVIKESMQSLWIEIVKKYQKLGFCSTKSIKDCIPQVPDETRAIPGVKNDMLSTKVVDNQKDELMKKATKAKGRRVVNSTELTSMNSKTNSDVLNDDIVRKVTDHQKRGELRLLTVADLKCFLSARKVKVGGTKEMLIKRVAELIG